MKSKKIIIISMPLFILFIMLIIKDNKSSLIGAYIDGEYSSTIPGKDDGYVVEKIVCDNDATGKWDYNSWGILTTNMTKKSKCNIYFKKGIRLADINTYVDDTGKCPTVNSDGTVNVTGAESENSLLCSAPDNYGTSYYFRGNVQNNYVKFAGFYWRIVRINGDGSIRLIYDGTSVHQNGEASEDRIIGKSAFNEKNDDNAYVGYMYGTPGSSTYEETHANINDSTIKKYVDTWYENNLKNTMYEEYLSDNIFCNDRYLLRGNGHGTFYTAYRWTDVYNVPSLYCNLKNDALTVHDTTIGSNSLKYGISLITADEAEMSGVYYNQSNSKIYLFIGMYYATTSSIAFTDIDNDKNYKAMVSYIRADGGINWDDGYINVGTSFNYGVKPVINLKPNSLKSGDGTINNPYTVE